MTDLTWTDKPPTEPEWYMWEPWDYPERPRVNVELFSFCGRIVGRSVPGEPLGVVAIYMPGRWAGPIPEPREVE